jgi:hypothetical protein
MLALFALAVGFAVPGFAEDEKSWSLDVGVDRADKYLFRGVILTGDESILIPHAALGIGNLNLYYYGYFGKIEGFESDYGETDLGIDYGIPLGDKTTLTLGAVTYLYNGQAERDLAFLDTYEAYGILKFDTFLSPTISYFEDLDEVEGGYAAFGLSHGFELGSKVTLTLAGQVGVDFGYNLNAGLAESLGIAESNGDLSDGLVGVDLSFAFTDSFSGHLLAQRVIALDVLDDIGRDDETVVTAGLGYSF